MSRNVEVEKQQRGRSGRGRWLAIGMAGVVVTGLLVLLLLKLGEGPVGSDGSAGAARTADRVGLDNQHNTAAAVWRARQISAGMTAELAPGLVPAAVVEPPVPAPARATAAPATAQPPPPGSFNPPKISRTGVNGRRPPRRIIGLQD